MEKKTRPYLGMHFKCCNVYVRIYLNRRGTAYFGHCPKCMRAVSVRAVPGAKKAKFWTVE